jgi:hypothetical protein
MLASRRSRDVREDGGAFLTPQAWGDGCFDHASSPRPLDELNRSDEIFYHNAIWRDPLAMSSKDGIHHIMILSAIDRDSKMPAQLGARRMVPHPRRADWVQLEMKPGEVKLALVREERFSNQDTAPTLIATLAEATETARSWYGTGNPFALRTLLTVPVQAAGERGRLQLRRLPLVERIAHDLGVALPDWDSAVPGTLPDHEMPQNRWLVASRRALLAWFDRWLDGTPTVEFGDRAPVPSARQKRCLYLTHAMNAGGWVKVGKADTQTVGQRIQAQQLCSPYRLQHLGIWHVPADLGAVGKLETALRHVVGTGAEVRSEWIRIPPEHALAKARLYAARAGLLPLSVP